MNKYKVTMKDGTIHIIEGVSSIDVMGNLWYENYKKKSYLICKKHIKYIEEIKENKCNEI